MIKHCGLLMLLALSSGQSWASQYAIQLEASKSKSKSPQLERYQALSKHGNLYTETASNGYVRTRLGPYESQSMAFDILKKVHAAGYTNAIVTKQKSSNITTPSVSSESSESSTTLKQQYDIENFDVKTLKEWDMLTPEQQSNLVYLDGMLHVKDGNKFIPLHEITGQK